MTEVPNPHIIDADTLTGEMRPIRRIVLAIGSNLGDRMASLQGAVSALVSGYLFGRGHPSWLFFIFAGCYACAALCWLGVDASRPLRAEPET